MSLYPSLHEELAAPDAQAHQQFRLQRIDELENFLRSEIESRRCLSKKYRRVVNALDATCAALHIICITTGAVGAGLLASGIGFIPGLALEAATGVAGLLEIVDVAVSRRCSAKLAKHEAVRILASSKLNTIHSHISKALEDCQVSDEEYKLILNEIEKYRSMKEQIRRKHVPAIIDDQTKNELIRHARASLLKKLGT